MTLFRKKAEPGADFRLGNGEARNAEHPRTFFIPPRAERERVRPGELVKLLFEVANPAPGVPSAERMWVRVTQARGHRYVGALDSTPAFLTTIGAGDLVEFGPEHIISLVEDWPLGDLKAVVSRRSHLEDVRPRYVCRDEPIRPTDSGWQVLIGDETDEELDDSSNILLQALGFVVNRWPELRAVFTAGEIGSEWVWDDEQATYVPLRTDG